jgi:hypothetical protein
MVVRHGRNYYSPVEWPAQGLPPGQHLRIRHEVRQTSQLRLLEAKRRAERRIERLLERLLEQEEVKVEVKVEVKAEEKREIRAKTHVPTQRTTQSKIRPDVHREILRETQPILDFGFWIEVSRTAESGAESASCAESVGFLCPAGRDPSSASG